MKATTKITVLAVAIAAALAAPALAFAGPGLHDMAIGEHLTLEPVLAAPVLDPAIAAHMVIDPAVFDLVASEDATLGDPPVAPKEPWVGIVVAPHTDTETVTIPDEPSRENTPTIPLIPREPHLPFTGGDATPWMIGGLVAMLTGVALMVAVPRARKSRVRAR
jgi:hypothetical protein